MPPSRPRLEWTAALLLFAAATIAFNLPGMLAPDARRAAPKEALAPHKDALGSNDTDEFIRLIDTFAARFREAPGEAFRRDVVFPDPEFDAPPTFVVTGGLAEAFTGWPAVRVMNAFTMAAVFLNGVAAFGFLRAVGIAWPLTAVAALGYMAPNGVPYALHMGHMNYVQLQWIAFAFWALAELTKPGAGWRPAIGLGAAMGFQLMSSPTFSLYLAYVGLPVFAAVRLASTPPADRPASGRLAVQALISVGVAFAIASPYLALRLEMMPGANAVPGPAFTWNGFREFFDPTHPVLFIGAPLAALGVLAVRWWWHDRNPVVTALVATLFAAAACMLPDVPPSPFWVLHEYAPLFDRVRVPIRFFPIALLMLLGLVGSYLTTCAGDSPRSRRLAAGLLFLGLLAGNWIPSAWIGGFDVVP